MILFVKLYCIAIDVVIVYSINVYVEVLSFNDRTQVEHKCFRTTYTIQVSNACMYQC